jgi:hypothetical protein
MPQDRRSAPKEWSTYLLKWSLRNHRDLFYSFVRWPHTHHHKVSMPHPYQSFEDSPTWRVLDAAIRDLEENRDLEVTTARPYVLGFLCMRLAEAAAAPAHPSGPSTRAT